MSRLIGAELNRWFSRRLVWVVFAASVLLTLLVVAGTAYSARPMSSQELAYAEQQYTEMKQEAEREAQQCLRDGGTAEECASWTPERSDFVREPPPYAALAGGMAQAGTMIAAYAALLAGASFIGAEFKTGNIGTWLTYVPSRLPVLVSKAVAAAVGVTLLGVAVIGLFQAGAAGIVLAWAEPGALQPAAEAWAMAGRGLLLVLIAGLVGFALAGLFGSTVGPVGLLLGLMVLQWAIGLIALVMGGSAWLQAALPDPNIQAFLAGSTEIAYAERGPNGAMVEATYTLGLGQASAYLGGLLAVVLALAGWRFTTREIR
ncbi:hypothetical protein [Micropruina sp.]|uniref:ABC transporter permease subunit n=1 Tax=Micropruina sp. TaxID=2737536 RepID=UPI002609A432|nr:hypothetical protein [Micropruina sp.]